MSRVEFGYHGGLFAIYFDTFADHLLRCVVGASRLLAAQQDTFYQLLFGYIEVDHLVDFQSAGREQTIELFGLVDRARESVEDVAFGVLVFRYIVVYHVDDNLVGSQFALRGVGFHLFSQLGSPCYLIADHFAGRYVIDSVLLFEQRGLRSFAASRSSEQNDIQHGRMCGLNFLRQQI